MGRTLHRLLATPTVRFTSIADVAALVARTRPRLVAIVGAPGAGKSTVAAALQPLVPQSALLPMDGFHLPQATLVSLGRRDRMGAPDTFDVDGFVATLEAVRAAKETVFAPDFDRDIEEPIANAIALQPELATIIVEGNYLLLDNDGWERVGPLLDTTFFIHIDQSVRQQRLIARHERFGKKPADAAAWALGPDEVNAALVASTAPRADHVIDLPENRLGS